MPSQRPRRPARMTGRWTAIALAIAVHALFIGVLMFSLRWQNAKPEAVTAELYAPPAKTALREPPPVTPPEPRPAVKPPIAEPKPTPKPEPAPQPKVERPDTRAADIALQAKKEEERRRVEREKQELARKEDDRRRIERERLELAKREVTRREIEKRELEKKDVEKRERIEQAKKQEQQRVTEARERQSKEAEALRAQAERERLVAAENQRRSEAQTEANARAEANARTRAEANARAHAEASRAEADYKARIQQKIRGNVIVPADVVGNPEAIFDVVQLPTGEIIEATLKKSSGVRAYDDAVQRAILKSSPLPRPADPDLFQRTLTLKFRPKES